MVIDNGYKLAHVTEDNNNYSIHLVHSFWAIIYHCSVQLKA